MIKRIKRLQSYQAIQSKDRNSCVDVFRGVAIIMVILFHFGYFDYGNIGVDLFFVISGLLVGGLLTRKFNRGERINFFKFFLQRGFKIWPSYYVFLALGNLLAFLFYHNLSPEQIIKPGEFKPYIFFFQNYSSQAFRWSFGHVWSLCVEEHFYILLPLLFIVVQLISTNKKVLIFSVISVIFLGIAMKELSILYTRSKDTYDTTHARIDSLAWGVLLTLIITYFPQWLKKKRIYLISVLGFVMAIGALVLDERLKSYFYTKVVLHSVLPFCFFLMIAGLYHYDLSKLKLLRLISYYSYNWYLWHVVFIVFIGHYIGYGPIGLIIYILVTFSTAVFFTIMIEEPTLKVRRAVLDRIFRTQSKLVS